MDVSEAKLTCPFCGAAYQARDTACPRCGRALSPTGYSQYSEQTRIESQPIVSTAPIVPPVRAKVDRADRPRTREAQIQPWRYYVPIGVITVLIISFFILNGQSGRDVITVLRPIAVPPDTPISVRPFACLPPPEATLYPVMPIAVPSANAGLPGAVGTMAYLPVTATPGQPSAPPRVSYILTLTTTKGVLWAKMYDVGIAFSIFSPVAALENKSFRKLGTQDLNAKDVMFDIDLLQDEAVVIDTADTATATFSPNRLQPQCGSLLLPIRNDLLDDDKILLISHDYPSITRRLTSSKNLSYLVVGQLVEGYDVLGALNAGDMVTGASVGKYNPLKGRDEAGKTRNGWKMRKFSLQWALMHFIRAYTMRPYITCYFCGGGCTVKLNTHSPGMAVKPGRVGIGWPAGTHTPTASRLPFTPRERDMSLKSLYCKPDTVTAQIPSCLYSGSSSKLRSEK